MKKNLYFIFIITILLFLYIFLLSLNYVKSVSCNLSENVFRLHIIANSDSEEDQSLKLKVRDNIVNYMNQLSDNCSNKNDVLALVKNNVNNFKEIDLNSPNFNFFDLNITSLFK